ncbi:MULTISPECIES: hypothetical protein [unclassified Rhodococcus (in: high G+C Gram-positive bacteria)]|uniref:hypothetical protein n=1 Tax=unclassified Rhodococcus (in: high G+C Gram-positive bacteria) TaxID=192944 RepID=UPI00163B5CE1|nr:MULTISPECIES: hypothetical protein [unclassified Rhodococcus (in: high G+C Gram-positive bacteria)]MBC2639290.1 hypothetical protein [Rhodococcus sp. 3A]MBC2895965.1 hypothetical protein [Rhodococcus sp. 4CII]
MRHRTAAVNRVIVLLVGLALLGFGAYAVAWDLRVPLVREWVARYDRERVTALPDQDWWGWALAATVLVGLVFGIVLLALDLTRRRTSPVAVPDRESGTFVTVDLGSLANGVASELAQYPGVRQTRARAVIERGLPTLSIVVTADATLDIYDFTRKSEDVASWVASTLGGQEVATQVLLHLDRADHPVHVES